jgi:hypothetical protein
MMDQFLLLWVSLRGTGFTGSVKTHLVEGTGFSPYINANKAQGL